MIKAPHKDPIKHFHPKLSGYPAKDTSINHKQLSAYSRRVKVLRKVLPLGGVVLVSIIVAWPIGKKLWEKPVDGIPPISKKMILENRLINPKLVDMDEKKNPFSISAKSSVQQRENKSKLEKPQGTITMNDTEIKITSDQGSYNQETGAFTYQDNVTLTTSDGYVFKTVKAQVNVKTQTAKGEDPIEGTGPIGDITASKGFSIDKNAKTLVFYGDTRLLLSDHKKDRP